MEHIDATHEELESLMTALMHRYGATRDRETCLQLGTLVCLCTMLLDDQAPLTAPQKAECRRGLLADAASLGVHLIH